MRLAGYAAAVLLTLPLRPQVIIGSPFTGGSGGGGGGGGLPDPGSNGMVARTAASTTAARTITAGTGIVMTNGDGASGNPVVDIDTATTPQFSSGTATPAAACTVTSLYLETDRNHLWWCTSTNTWTDIGPGLTSPVGATDGGTGQTTATQGDILYASAANTWSKLGAGTSGQFLKTQGAGADPLWADASGSTFDPSTTITLYDDFQSGLATAGNIGATGWTFGAISTGTLTIPAGTATNPGLLRLNSHATNDNSGLTLNPGNIASAWGSGVSSFDGGTWSIDTVIIPGSNSTAITSAFWVFGLSNTATAIPMAANGGIYVRWDSDLSDTTYIFAVCSATASGCASAGDDTNQKVVASTVTPVAGTPNRLRISQDLTGPGSTRKISFRVNNETAKTFCSSGCDDTLATAPSAKTLTPVFVYGTRTTTGVLSGDIDYFYYTATPAAARY